MNETIYEYEGRKYEESQCRTCGHKDIRPPQVGEVFLHTNLKLTDKCRTHYPKDQKETTNGRTA